MSKERMEGGPRRNSSSDMVNAAQVRILTIRVTLQEALMIGTCLMNIREKEGNTKISKGKLPPPH